MNNNSKLLVVLTGSLGDILRGFVILKPLKDSYPKLHISWVTDERWKDLVDCHPLIDRTLIFKRSEGASGFYRTIRNLRKLNFDCVFDMQRNIKSGIFSYFSGSKKRIGFHKKNTKEFNWIFNNHYIDFLNENVSKVTHYKLFLKATGISTKLDEVNFGVPDRFYEKFLPPDFILTENKKIGLLLGSSWISKDWYESYYIDLAIKLVDKFKCQIILLGDKSRQKISLAIQDKLNPNDIQNYVGKTSLRELAAILEKVDLCVGPDSGPGHLAAVVNTPYIGIFGPTNPARVAPWGNESLAISHKVGCAPCLKRVCPGLGNVCMKLIKSEDIIVKVPQALTFSKERS